MYSAALRPWSWLLNPRVGRRKQRAVSGLVVGGGVPLLLGLLLLLVLPYPSARRSFILSGSTLPKYMGSALPTKLQK